MCTQSLHHIPKKGKFGQTLFTLELPASKESVVLSPQLFLSHKDWMKKQNRGSAGLMNLFLVN